MESLVTLINEVVNNKSQTPSLNNINNITPLPQVSPITAKDGYEPIKLEGNDKVFSPIISNKDNSDTKTYNINSESLKEVEFSPKELNLEVLSQQSSSQPQSFFPTHTAGHKLSTIAKRTEISTPKVQRSKLETQLLRPTALSRSSSSDGSVSSKESEVSDLSGEKKFDKEDNCVTKQSRRVYSHNRDALSKIFDQNIKEQPVCGGEEGEKITSDNSIKPTNYISNITPIPSSNFNSSEHSSILKSSSVLDSVIHSDKSILGSDLYNSINQGHSSIAVTSSPSPSLSSRSDRFPNISSPLKNIKEGRTGLRKEDKYPSPGVYFSQKSGPMGDLSGGLSLNKRPRFYSPPNLERFPAPSIDTTRERMSGRMAMEGWPSSPRRMQLASPRLKSLNDLVEGPEGSEQQESSSWRTNTLSSNNMPESSNDQTIHPIKLNLNSISEDEEEKERKIEKTLEKSERGEKVEQKNEEKDILSKPGKFFGASRTKNSRFVDLMSNDDSSPIPSLLNQSFGKRQPMLSSSRSTLSNSRRSLGHESGTSLLQDMQSISEEEKEGSDVVEEQEKTKSRSEKRLSESFLPNLDEINEEEESEELDEQKEQTRSLLNISKNGSNRKTRTLGIDYFSSKEKSKEKPVEELPLRKSSGARIARFFPSIQSRRTMPQLTVRTPLSAFSISETEDEDEEETEMSSDNTGGQYIPPSDQSDISPSTATMTPPTTSSAPVTPAKSTSWRWPKRPFSPAREKNREELVKSDDNPADHIGKVGSNIWAKKTLGQLRKYHQRHSPSILSRMTSPLKESASPLQSPVSDISDSKKSPAVSIPEQPLETINEEDDEEIGIWSSEEVDLTVDEKKLSSINNSILNPSKIIDEEPQGMKVSPEYLTVVGGTTSSRDSPNASSTSVALRNNPSPSSSVKHSTKPLFETTFTISNITDNPLKYEILWPAFRFDITPAYGVVKPQSVTLVKISVTHKHLSVGSKREDAKKLMGIINKGSEKNNDDKPLMSKTRILVLCENGERSEVLVDIIPLKKDTKGEIEPIRLASKNVREENGNFISRFGKPGGKISRTVDDLIKAARARTKKQAKPEDKHRLTKSSKGKSAAVGSTSRTPSAPPLRRSNSSKPPSRSSSPEGSNRNRVVRKKASSSSLRSRPDTPDRKHSVSPSPITCSRTPDESKPVKQLPQRKNFLYVGVPGNISCSSTIIRETNHSVFCIQNPTNKPVTWHLTTATNPFLRRSESTSSSAQKINDEVFLIMKTSGFLRPGQTEKVVVGFRPVFVGTYHQNFRLEDSMNAEGAGGLGGVSVRIQGEGKVDVSAPIRPDTKRNTGSRIRDFEVAETEVNIAATRVGKRRSVGIKIYNHSSQLIRIKCKMELKSDANESSTALSIPLSSVQIKPSAFVVLPVRFQPKEIGEIRGIVRLQAVGRKEVKVDVIAEGISDAPSEAL